MSTLADEIKILIKAEANNNPAPERCTIKKLYDDKEHCDIETISGELKYVDVIGDNVQLGSNAVILYFDENYEDYVVIADTSLKDYYTKEQIDNMFAEIRAMIGAAITYIEK